MKKIISILFLLVFLFNVVGYKIFFYYLEIKADERMLSKIEEISELDKDLITIKIPINLPYHTDWAKFERVDGEVNFKGKIYKYVKQKIQKDTLILLCINDFEKTEINKHKNDYVKKVNDVTTDTNKKPVLKLSKTDYFETIVEVKFTLSTSLKQQNLLPKKQTYPLGFSRKLIMPPQHS